MSAWGVEVLAVDAVAVVRAVRGTTSVLTSVSSSIVGRSLRGTRAACPGPRTTDGRRDLVEGNRQLRTGQVRRERCCDRSEAGDPVESGDGRGGRIGQEGDPIARPDPRQSPAGA